MGIGAAYTASKHGLLGVTKNTAAAYWKQGIRSNIILAGPMHTNIGTHLQQAGVASQHGFGILNTTCTYRQAGQKYVCCCTNDCSLIDPMMNEQGRESLCDLEKMAKLVLSLCSEDSSLVSGAVIQADMGYTAYQ